MFGSHLSVFQIFNMTKENLPTEFNLDFGNASFLQLRRRGRIHLPDAPPPIPVFPCLPKIPDPMSRAPSVRWRLCAHRPYTPAQFPKSKSP